MKILETEALRIAREFAISEYKDSKFPLKLNDANITLEVGGIGHSVLGLNECYWSVLFSLGSEDPNVAVVDPDHVIILVDSESGKAVWLPLM